MEHSTHKKTWNSLKKEPNFKLKTAKLGSTDFGPVIETVQEPISGKRKGTHAGHKVINSWAQSQDESTEVNYRNETFFDT